MQTRQITTCVFIILGALLSATLTRATDYSNPNNWMQTSYYGDQPVDVFYLYPTARDPGAPYNDINDPAMRAQANYFLAAQASAFAPFANVYAPYYRQADATQVLGQDFDVQDSITSDIPKEDALAAFDYYIKNYNNGRPFILAGHSQGSNMLLYIMSEYLQANPDVANRMVASYAIGYGVSQDYLDANPHLQFAQGAGDLGVIISWNTEAEGVAPLGANPVVRPNSISIKGETQGFIQPARIVIKP